MGQSVFTGPVIAAGGFAGAPDGAAPAEYSAEIGPSLFWQGSGLLAPGRGSKDKKGMGAFPALYLAASLVVMSQIIQAAGVALTVAGPATSGTSLPLVSAYALGRSPATPWNGSLGVGIETAFAIGGTTSGSGTVTINSNDKWRFSPGMFVSIGGAGPGGAMLMTKVVAVGGAGVNTIAVSPAPATTQGSASIGAYAGDPSSYGFVLPTSYSPFMNGGAGRFLLPDSACARGVGVVGVAGSPGGQVLIQGLDVFMRPQSEIITCPAGAATTYGRKTYKVLLAAIPQFTSTQNYTVVTSDLIGLPLSALPNQIAPQVTMAGAAYAGDFVQYADLTNPATTATADPRGAVQLSPAGPNAGVTGTGPDGVSAFTIVMTLNPAQVLSASQFNPGPLFGVAPV